MSRNKENDNFVIFMCLGLIFGVILDQIALGLCIGVAIGLGLDDDKKEKINKINIKNL